MGSPLIVYLFIAFWMNIKRYITNGKRNPVGIGNEMLNA